MAKITGWGSWKDLSGDLIVENNVHSIDVLNWFLGGRPVSAIGSGGSTTPKQGDIRDHNFVAFEYRNESPANPPTFGIVTVLARVRSQGPWTYPPGRT
jgi:predicted dehydrogenase